MELSKNADVPYVLEKPEETAEQQEQSIKEPVQQEEARKRNKSKQVIETRNLEI